MRLPNGEPPANLVILAELDTELEALRVLRRQAEVKKDAGLLHRIDRAIEAASCPTCAEAQADGVPCATSSRACDECVTALSYVRSQRGDLERELDR